MLHNLVDSHCHLQIEQFDADRDQVIERAREAGVCAIITLATDLATSRQVIALAEQYDMVYAAVGIHPTEAAAAGADDLVEIARLAEHPKVVAIGESGMDLYWDTSTEAIQEQFFIRQIELAVEHDLPIVIHNRNAGAAVLRALDNVPHLPVRGVFHCFSEDTDYAREVLRRGFHVSFTGNLTYKKSTLPEVAAMVPLNRLLLETDSPFLAPVPKRGKRNEPAFVQYIAEKHAEIRGVSAQAIAGATRQTANELFGI